MILILILWILEGNCIFLILYNIDGNGDSVIILYFLKGSSGFNAVVEEWGR
jgi:hypothetical protein